ncbi:hypothetical protein RKD29_007917 [Streptomyces tendae]|uniref:hypothetical protein n=1 Tax=Streptomyces tendae TaxID=1932 RepID=UPI00383846CF
MSRTSALWQEHGVVMRAATDLNRSVPEVGALWSHAAEVFIEAITRILHRAGVPEGDAPHAAGPRQSPVLDDRANLLPCLAGW